MRLGLAVRESLHRYVYKVSSTPHSRGQRGHDYLRISSLDIAVMAESPGKMYVLVAMLMLLGIMAVALRFFVMHVQVGTDT